MWAISYSVRRTVPVPWEIPSPHRISIDGLSVGFLMTIRTPEAPNVMDQPAAASPAQPPTPPAPATVATPAATSAARPTTFADLEALRARRGELSRQITSASERRSDAVRALRNSPDGPARAGLEGRIAVLDQRIMQLEQDISVNGQALANAPGNLIASEDAPSTLRYGPFSPGQLTAITIISIIFVWAPLAFAATRLMMRRWAHPKPAPQILESSARLERMEQAIDAVAIEIERISEGQRFVTQTLAKRDAAPALGVGQAPAEPIRVGDAQTVAR